jgi:hypothetical protein
MGNHNEFQCSEHGAAGLLPNHPYLALYPHYGMLLGVDDFAAEQAYHRGKMRLHNAWLHGWGAIWGLGVKAEIARSEIEVAPGLALDGYGRELHNDQPQCVHVGRWFAAHREDPGFEFEENGNTVGFDAHVVIRHRACLMRPVPALLDTCSNSGGTAYSRVYESVEILLRPGPAPLATYRNHLLRVLLGMDEALEDDDGNVLPDDQAALDARAEIIAAPPADRLTVATLAFHRISVLDSIADQPSTDPDDAEALLFPAQGPSEIVLANVSDISLELQGENYVLTAATVDNHARSVLLSSASMQALSVGFLAAIT